MTGQKNYRKDVWLTLTVTTLLILATGNGVSRVIFGEFTSDTLVFPSLMLHNSFPIYVTEADRP